MLRRVPRLLLLPMLALVVGISAPPAFATVNGEGVGNGVFLESDGAGDEVTLSCEGGMAPQGASTQIPCAEVETVVVSAGGGDDTVKLENVGKSTFPELKRAEIRTGEGADTVFATQVADTVLADEEDTVSSGPGADLIEGAGESLAGEGDDIVVEPNGPASGGPGDDRVEDPRSLELIEGGPGADTVAFDFPADEPLSVAFVIRDDGLEFSNGPIGATFVWASIERAELFLSDLGTQSVVASGFSGSIEVDGRGGPDTIVGSPGEDVISGGPGDDDLTGEGGFDWVKGGEGDDRLDLRDAGVDRGVCGEGSDHVIADRVDSFAQCELVDLPAAEDSSSGATEEASPPSSDAAAELLALLFSPAPDTTGLKGPKSVRKGSKATFRFASSVKGSSFKCKVDKAPFKACRSPFHLATGKLTPGRHAIAVVAVGANGGVDPTPATLKFSVVPAAKPGKHGQA